MNGKLTGKPAFQGLIPELYKMGKLKRIWKIFPQEIGNLRESDPEEILIVNLPVFGILKEQRGNVSQWLMNLRWKQALIFTTGK